MIKLQRTPSFILCAIVFKLTLEVAYVEFIVKVFDYEGYELSFKLVKYIESWVYFIALVCVTPQRLSRPSDYFINVNLFFFLAPLLAFYGATDADRNSLLIVLMSVGLVYIFRLGGALQLPWIKRGEWMAYSLLFAGVASVTTWMVVSGGTEVFNLNMELVYEFRDSAGELIDKGIMAYINVWAQKVFGPVLLAIALWKRKYSMALIVLSLHVFWFGISSHKSVLFYPFVIFFLWIFFRKEKALSVIPLGLTLVVAASLLLYFVTSEIFLGSMLIRRALFVPAKLTFAYYEFFSSSPMVYWSNSITSWFITYPYDKNTALLIGEFLGDDTTAANNSFFSTGYMHAGVYGMIIYGVIVGILFRLVDELSRDVLPVWISVSIVIVPALALLTSADLPTAVLTHGLGVSMILLFLFRSLKKD